MNFALSAFIFAVSLFFVSENWVAITTRQRLIMKKDPTWGKYSILVLYPSKTVLLTRPKVSGSSSRFQGGRGNSQVTRQLSFRYSYHNQTDKVDPVPEWVSILYKVHDISPSLQWYDQEYGHPGNPNVVKWNGPMKWIRWPGGALGVVLNIFWNISNVHL